MTKTPARNSMMGLNDIFLIIFWYTIAVCDTFDLVLLPEIQT